ncbi:helix-turn-helix domain-containing protein [Hyphomicrobium sp. DMF-1]|jgi:transcriptional regulator with XRE-family HTH domain|uniref:helix-turn-helix domain-containing protein n=1 Tax=Hyphomicrobium sp. DMF-1 TaxID=3019544 RepID=UPI0022EBEC3E|nr:helix-turn-helix transcriptional regulator [Hyphomicrobium sp. DMF-1]WBT39955.1 helix-turn-helix transcriptional regulator [Hyphomicrobium sp. DMF-1]
MNKLKDLRTRFGFTQKQVAEHLQTTQQTVQRWESGQTEIPASHLKDLSVLFGCSIDELLGVDAKAKRRTEGFARARHETPWGTLKVTFAFGEREYPIDDHEYADLIDEFHSAVEIARPSGWVQFTALDNRLVFLNPAFVLEIEAVTDDQEAMPFFASPEAYQALSKDSPLTDAGPLLQEECTSLLTHLNMRSPPGETDLDEVQEQLNSLEVIRGDGKSVRQFLSDDLATSVFILEGRREIKPNSFLTVSAEDGNYHCMNLTAVAAIEVPVEAYLAHMAKDGGEDED